jgi:SurA N-terminal domain.
MKKRVKIALITLFILLASMVVYSTFAVGGANKDDFLLGEIFNPEKASKDDTIVATFKGQPITGAELDRQMKINDFTASTTYPEGYTPPAKKTEAEAVDQLLLDKILLEEAKKRGLLASDEDVANAMKSLKEVYEIPEGKVRIDEVCKGMGMTFDEYWAYTEEYMPRTISRQNVLAEFKQQYCESNGLDLTVMDVDQYEEYEAALDEYQTSLLSAYNADIEYFPN